MVDSLGISVNPVDTLGTLVNPMVTLEAKVF